MPRLLLISSLVLLGSMAIQAAHHINVTHCDDVRKMCTDNPTCDASQMIFRSSCDGPLKGYGSCTKACKDAHDDVLKDPIGQKFNVCMCDDMDYSCKAERSNFGFSCYGMAPPSQMVCDSTPPTNATGQVCPIMNCKNNAACNKTFNTYVATCIASAFEGKDCQAPCKASLDEYLCNPIISSARGCQCEYGNGECFTVSTNLVDKCYGVKYPMSAPTQQSCESVIVACYLDMECNKTYFNYQRDCANLFGGKETTCSAACNSSFEAFAKNPIGYHVTSCSCGSDTQCQRDEALTAKICLNIDLLYPQNCNYILGGCGMDSRCNTTLNAYFTACMPDALSGKCSDNCKAAATAMFQNPIGMRLGQCYCPSDDTTCLGVQRLTGDCFATATQNPATMRPATKRPATKRPATKKPTSSAGATFLAFSAVLGTVASLLL